MSGTAVGAEKSRTRRTTLRANEPVTCRNLTTGVDTLHLYTKAGLRKALVSELERLKEEAQAREDEPQEHAAPVFSFGGLDFEVKPYGVKKGPLVLVSDALTLVVQPRPPKNLPTAYVELRAEFLWAAGYERAADKASELLELLTVTEAEPQVSRLDLAVDFMGFQPSPAMLKHIVGRVVRRNSNWVESHDRGRRFTGFTFGGGPLLSRLYNKSVEIKVSGKQWCEALWRAGGWKGEELDGQVWRLEFQLRREVMREAQLFRGDNDAADLTTWSAAKDGLNALWLYLSSKWLTYRLPRTGKERVRMHPQWLVLMGARFRSCPAAELYRHRAEWSLRRTTGALAGYIKRGLAELWMEQDHEPTQLRLKDDLDALLRRADEHYKNRHPDELYFDARRFFETQQKVRRLFG